MCFFRRKKIQLPDSLTKENQFQFKDAYRFLSEAESKAFAEEKNLRSLTINGLLLYYDTTPSISVESVGNGREAIENITVKKKPLPKFSNKDFSGLIVCKKSVMFIERSVDNPLPKSGKFKGTRRASLGGGNITIGDNCVIG